MPLRWIGRRYGYLEAILFIVLFMVFIIEIVSFLLKNKKEKGPESKR
jgi:cbb3-type cytochrome oxidase subunit 3